MVAFLVIACSFGLLTIAHVSSACLDVCGTVTDCGRSALPAGPILPYSDPLIGFKQRPGINNPFMYPGRPVNYRPPRCRSPYVGHEIETQDIEIRKCDIVILPADEALDDTGSASVVYDMPTEEVAEKPVEEEYTIQEEIDFLFVMSEESIVDEYIVEEYKIQEESIEGDCAQGCTVQEDTYWLLDIKEEFTKEELIIIEEEYFEVDFGQEDSNQEDQKDPTEEDVTQEGPTEEDSTQEDVVQEYPVGRCCLLAHTEEHTVPANCCARPTCVADTRQTNLYDAFPHGHPYPQITPVDLALAFILALKERCEAFGDCDCGSQLNNL